MEARSTWTDERLDDRFDHIDSELTQLRQEMRQGFGELRGEIAGLGTVLRGEIAGQGQDLRGEIGGLRGEVNEMRTLMVRLYGAQAVAFLGVIAAVLIRGG